jgi:hypothetical protein
MATLIVLCLVVLTPVAAVVALLQWMAGGDRR